MRLFITLLAVLGVNAEGRRLFSVQKSELENGAVDLPGLQTALKNDGAFAVTGNSLSYTNAIQELKALAPPCFKDARFPEISLADGSMRTTFATNMDKFYPHCILDSSSVISDEFDAAFSLVSAALEDLAGGVDLQWREEAGEEVRSFKSLPHKDHIHVYETTHKSKASDTESLPFHIDSGILLMLTPSADLPVQIKGADRELINTSAVGEDAIIFIVSRGLTDWLLQGKSAAKNYHAAPHAVPSLSGRVDSRVVFARMKVAPERAVPANSDASPVMFEEVFLEKILGSSGALCPSELTLSKKLPGLSCEPGSAECWMGCLQLPECSGQDYYVCTNLVGRPCCNENNSPPPDPVDGCLDMDPTCEWKCYSDPLF